MKPIYKILLFLIWSTLMLAGYYYYHKPVEPPQLLQAAQSLYDFLISGLILIICAGLGHKILRFDRRTDLAELSLQAALGSGVAGITWLGMGAIGLLYWWSAALLLLVGCITLRKDCLAWLRELKVVTSLWQNAGRMGRFFFLASMLLILNQLWMALAPPVKYDALTYHLALPRLYLEQGRLAFIADNPYWGHPQIVEMLYTWAMALGGSSTAAVLSWWAGVIFIFGLAGAVHHYLPKPGATEIQRANSSAAAVTFLLVGVTAQRMLGWAYSDLFSAWFGLAALLVFFRWLDSGDSAWMRWAGVFTGMAVSTKYTAGVIALAIFAGSWVIKGLRKPTFSLWLQSGFLALVIFLPWAIKNTVATGNPLFPYVLPTPGYSTARLADANLPPEQYAWLPQIALPVYLTWTGVDSASGPSTDLGALLVIFAIPGLIAFRRDRKVQMLVFSLAIVWLAISLAGARFGHLQQPRLYFCLLSALVLLAGWGWTAVQEITANGVRLNRLAGVIACLSIGLALWQSTIYLLTTQAVPTAFGVRSRDAYLHDQTGAYYMAMRSMDGLPQDSRVLMLWEARGLYAPAFAVPDPWIDRWRSAQHDAGSAEAVLAQWRSQGVTHLLIFTSGMEFMRESDAAVTLDGWLEFDRMINSLPPPSQLAGDYYLLYDINQ
jgi:hypothetical protein